MTAEEMYFECELLYESFGSGDAPGYDEREWSYFLTLAQDTVVKSIVEDYLDREERYKKALSPIYNPQSVDTIDTEYTALANAYEITIQPSWKVTMERIHLSDGTVVPVKPIKYDQYLANIKNFFKKPNKRYTYWRLQGTGNTHIIIGDADISTASSYKYVGVNKPDPIIVPDDYVDDDGSIDEVNFEDHPTGQDCALGTFIHRWIVKEAVAAARAADKDGLGYQLSTAENRRNIQSINN